MREAFVQMYDTTEASVAKPEHDQHPATKLRNPSWRLNDRAVNSEMSLG